MLFSPKVSTVPLRRSIMVPQKKNNDNLANIEDFRRFALILCSLRSSAQELQHI
ncbi:hypothetical protein BCR32DRAFT_285393 [Anaeromyces robustus]|uniref:Uncharacterized protein n=1 Tax=Anaeromyces robustus TaxID=1754192 RepID=A0A1Y1WNT4_9FUNG|nr:hypothetical protein BCR32DRAFT_285393 [Anaeromyces robustus]|eukprot:ORX75201.1 hypothetical protein BCR32DRAFT_285393 [Anaeromyces robustus]